jgi:hypothetical protein
MAITCMPSCDYLNLAEMKVSRLIYKGQVDVASSIVIN